MMNFRFPTLARSLVTLAAITALPASTDSAFAQFPPGASPPAVLAPKPAAPPQKQDPGARQPQRPTLNMTLVDPGPIGAETTTNIYFAQVAVGGGYSTVFTLTNTGSTTANGNLLLTGQDGNPFTVTVNSPSAASEPASSGELIGAAGSSFPVSVPPGGTKFFTATAVNASDPTKSGWARVASSGGSMGGVGTFQVVDIKGTLTTIVGVLAAQPVAFATIPVDDDSPNRSTGFAVANPGNTNISVKLITIDENGNVADNLSPQILNPLGPQKQVAIFLNQLAPNRLKFKGSMVLVAQSGQTFAVVALVLNQGLFTAIPVIPEKAPQVPN